MMFIITVIVISNMFLLTLEYLHFSSQKKIYIEENHDDGNLPRITLNAKVLRGFFEPLWNSSYLRRVKCKSYSEFFQTEFKSIRGEKNWEEYQLNECYKLETKNILDEKRISDIFDKYEYKFITSDNIYRLNDIDDKTSGFFCYYDYYINCAVSLTFDLNKIVQKSKNNIFIKIIYKSKKERFLDDKLNSFSLHWQPIVQVNEISIQWKNAQNYSLLVMKYRRSYLGPPYSQCSHYRSDTKRPFNALSHMQCYRHCLRTFAQNFKHINCTPFFIDNMITELDLLNKQGFCKYEMLKIFQMKINKDFSKKCLNICPNDCLTIDFSYSPQITDSEMDYMLEISKRESVLHRFTKTLM